MFWRLEILYICRTHALEYVRFLTARMPERLGKNLVGAIEHYRNYLDLFESKLTIVSQKESVEHGITLRWREGKSLSLLRDLFAEREGREEFASFFLGLSELEKMAYEQIEGARLQRNGFVFQLDGREIAPWGACNPRGLSIQPSLAMTVVG